MSNHVQSFSFRVDRIQNGIRLDTLVASEVDACSRSFAAVLIRQGHITVDGSRKKPGYPVKAGERVCGELITAETPPFSPEDIPLTILYEDAELIAVNKPAGLVVHPAPGHAGGTLVNALMHHCPNLPGISGQLRPGIVHRLDMDTSGVMVVAKTDRAMQRLAEQFKARRVRKHYLALVYGVPDKASGSVDLPIGRHPVDRKKMSTITRSARTALTYWTVVNVFAGAALLKLDIRTGRTHQIRVHCLSMGHPVIGDPVYRNRGNDRQLRDAEPKMFPVVRSCKRQMLHAWKLRFNHPVSGKRMAITASIAEDMADVIDHFESIQLSHAEDRDERIDGRD